MVPSVTPRRLAFIIVFAVTLLVTASAAAQSPYTPVTKYDPKRDAARDIDDAIAEAKRSNRRILLVVGGEWCGWCHKLDGFFATDLDLKALRDKNFVTVKVNFSDENQNVAVLSRYPPTQGYPHIFVLDSDGKLLHSQDTAELEGGKSYEPEKLTTFLMKWAPPLITSNTP